MYLVKKQSLIKIGHIIVIIVGFQFASAILSGMGIVSAWCPLPQSFSRWAVIIITSLGSIRLLDDIFVFLLNRLNKSGRDSNY